MGIVRKKNITATVGTEAERRFSILLPFKSGVLWTVGLTSGDGSTNASHGFGRVDLVYAPGVSAENVAMVDAWVLGPTTPPGSGTPFPNPEAVMLIPLRKFTGMETTSRWQGPMKFANNNGLLVQALVHQSTTTDGVWTLHVTWEGHDDER